MHDSNSKNPDNSMELGRAAVGLIWTAVMLVVTFAVDDPAPVIPFWLLLGAYFIVKRR